MTVERELAHASAMLEAVLCGESRYGVLEASAYPTATFGPTLELELANPAWRALFGAHPLDALAPYLAAVRSRDSVHVPSLAIGPVDCAVTVRAARGIGAIVVCEVIPEERALVRALAEAELANLRKDRFLAAVSHELRTPVTTMLLWDKVLRDDASDAPLRAQALDAIHDSALAQARLVGDLLDISRAISGKLHVDLRAIEIPRIVSEAVFGIAATAAARGIAIEAPADTPTRLVEGDAFRVRQILDNLLSNALKFTERGGRVAVAITSTARTVTIQVADTGRGIAPEFLQQMFEPFSQSEDAMGSGAGLGLGLAISKQLVELQHGTLTATSPGPGQGSTFSVTLPAAGRARAAAPAPSVPALPHRLVVVDDDRRVLDALSLLLERAGATVVTAASAELARRAITASTPDLVLCDIAMPGEDGYTLITGLRAAGVRVPAIALTAHAMATDAARAIAAGFDAHVAKPIDVDRLVAKIAQLIAERR